MLRFPDGERPAGRVFCIGKNYADHIAEMGSPPDDQCVVFMKPPSSLVAAGSDIELPRDRGAVHHEVEVVVALDRGGRDVAPADAHACIAGVSLGLDLTLRDVQKRLKERGHPWEVSKAFDGSAPIGSFTPLSEALELSAIPFTCAVNGDLRQQGNTAQMLFPVDRLIAILSQTWELRANDVIFTGTPAGVGPLVAGDTVVAESALLGRFEWRFH